MAACRIGAIQGAIQVSAKSFPGMGPCRPIIGRVTFGIQPEAVVDIVCRCGHHCRLPASRMASTNALTSLTGIHDHSRQRCRRRRDEYATSARDHPAASRRNARGRPAVSQPRGHTTGQFAAPKHPPDVHLARSSGVFLGQTTAAIEIGYDGSSVTGVSCTMAMFSSRFRPVRPEYRSWPGRFRPCAVKARKSGDPVDHSFPLVGNQNHAGNGRRPRVQPGSRWFNPGRQKVVDLTTAGSPA